MNDQSCRPRGSASDLVGSQLGRALWGVSCGLVVIGLLWPGTGAATRWVRVRDQRVTVWSSALLRDGARVLARRSGELARPCGHGDDRRGLDPRMGDRRHGGRLWARADPRDVPELACAAHQTWPTPIAPAGDRTGGSGRRSGVRTAFLPGSRGSRVPRETGAHARDGCTAGAPRREATSRCAWTATSEPGCGPRAVRRRSGCGEVGQPRLTRACVHAMRDAQHVLGAPRTARTT